MRQPYIVLAEENVSRKIIETLLTVSAVLQPDHNKYRVKLQHTVHIMAEWIIRGVVGGGLYCTPLSKARISLTMAVCLKLKICKTKPL